MRTTELKQILNLHLLEKLFGDYSLTSGLDISLYSTDGEEQLCVRRTGCICNYEKNGSVCRNSVIRNGKKSQELGGAYIFNTPCGVIMCIMPVVLDKEPIGFITMGPCILWENDDFFRTEFRDNRDKNGMLFDADAVDLQAIPYMDCKHLTSATEMLTVLVNYAVQQEKKYIRQRLEISKLTLQRMQAESEMRIRENTARCSKYPTELEKEIIAYVQMGDEKQAKKIINKFLGEIFSFAGGDMEIVKAKLYEFNAFLSRSAVEAGAPISSLTGIIKKSSSLLLANADFADLCRCTVDILDDFLKVLYDSRGQKTASEHLSKAIRYIGEHYADSINLGMVAKEVFVSQYYLSHLFRKEMGMTFSEYLNKVRIEHAKEFLMEGKSVEDIAYDVGYGDANYFMKTFKKYVGITPSKYRKNVANR